MNKTGNLRPERTVQFGLYVYLTPKCSRCFDRNLGVVPNGFLDISTNCHTDVLTYFDVGDTHRGDFDSL